MISEMLKDNRTKRVYDGTVVPFKILHELIEDCRYSASAMNKQDIRYILVNDNEICDEIFSITNLPTKHNVLKKNRPGAFVIMVICKDRKFPESFTYYNLGIITANLSLSAYSKGYNSVTLLSTDMEKLANIISLDSDMKAVSIVGIGKSEQKVTTISIEDGDTAYYKENDVHVVPKLSTKALIVKEI